MKINAFWQLIAQSRAAEGDQRAELARLLSQRSRQEIVQFAAIDSDMSARASTWHIFGAAGIAIDGHSEDGFIDFVDWLISAGEEIYTKVVEDPDSLVEHLDSVFPMYEGFGCAIGDSLELKGESTVWTKDDRKVLAAMGSSKRPDDPRTWNALEDLVALFPRLAEWDGGEVLP
jgi:hypothetical protein